MISDSILSNIKKYIEIRCLLPANEDDIIKAEKQLDLKFPAELVDLLKTSNGLELLMEHPTSKEPMVYDIAYWPVNEVVSSSNNMNKLFIDDKSNKRLLCFAGNGCGNVFCYIYDGDTLLPSIWIYYPIDGEICFFADNISEWSKEWFSGNKQT